MLLPTGCFVSVVADHIAELPVDLRHKCQDRPSDGKGGSTRHLVISIPIFHSLVYNRDLLKILMHLGRKGTAAILSNSCILWILPASISEHVATVIAPATHSVRFIIAHCVVHHTLRLLRVQL